MHTPYRIHTRLKKGIINREIFYLCIYSARKRAANKRYKKQVYMRKYEKDKYGNWEEADSMAEKYDAQADMLISFLNPAKISEFFAGTEEEKNMEDAEETYIDLKQLLSNQCVEKVLTLMQSGQYTLADDLRQFLLDKYIK